MAKIGRLHTAQQFVELMAYDQGTKKVKFTNKEEHCII